MLSIITGLALAFLALCACGIPTTKRPSERVLATKAATIGSEGGEIEAQGWRIVVPAGAVTSRTSFRVRQLDPQPYLEANSSGVLLDVVAPVRKFDHPIEYRISLPSWYAPQYAAAAMALLEEEETGELIYEPTSVQLRGGQPELVLRTDHLSRRFFQWLSEKLEYKFPPVQADVLEVPYYSQGITKYCWSAVLQMGAEGVRHSPDGELYSFIGALGTVSEGPSTVRLRFSSAIGKALEQRTGVKPKRLLWVAGQRQIQLEYIQREIAFNRRPVLLFSYTKSHAFVLVGYFDRESFYVHDPQQGSNNLYKRMTLEELGLDATGNTTIAIPLPLATDRPLVSVNLLDDFLAFQAPNNMVYSFRWDPTSSIGYAFWANWPRPKGKMVNSIPGAVTQIVADRVAFTGIEVANAYYQGTVKPVLIRIDITGHGPSKTSYSQQLTTYVGPRTAVRVQFDPIPVEAFRDPAPVSAKYTFKATALVDGKVTDDASFDFVLDPKVALEVNPQAISDGAPNTEYSFKATAKGIAPSSVKSIEWEWQLPSGARQVPKGQGVQETESDTASCAFPSAGDYTVIVALYDTTNGARTLLAEASVPVSIKSVSAPLGPCKCTCSFGPLVEGPKFFLMPPMCEGCEQWYECYDEWAEKCGCPSYRLTTDLGCMIRCCFGQ